MRAAEALAALAADPAAVVARLRGEGRRVMRVLGSDAPAATIAAAGFVPVRLAACPEGLARAHRLSESLIPNRGEGAENLRRIAY